MSATVSAVIAMTETGESSYVTTVTTRTSEAVAAQGATPNTNQAPRTQRRWRAREIQRLCELPLDSDDPAPARVEASISRLVDRVKDLPWDEDVVVSEDEDAVLREILRCEEQG